MTEKVKVTQKQLDWLERYKNDEEIAYAIDIQVYGRRPDSPIADWKTSEVARALYIGYEIEPVYKLGDWVVLESEDEGLLVIGKVVGFKNDGKDARVNDVNYKVPQTVPVKKLRHAESSEIQYAKNFKVWKSLGRKVDEFRDGDIGIFRSGFRISDLEDLKKYHESGDLIGFYPTESYISFWDGDENA